MARKKSATKKALESDKKAGIETPKETPKAIIPEAKEPIKKNNDLKLIEEDSNEDSSSDEEEDEYGELITDEVEQGISKVLDAIRSKDQALFDPNTRFFEDPEKAVENLAKGEKHKPIYLKDYHRMNLLAGGLPVDEDEDAPMEGTFVAEQRAERNQLLSEIKNAFGDAVDEDENSDDEFMKKKPKAASTKNEDTRLPNARIHAEEFLNAFIGGQAWLPKDGDKVVNLDRTSFEEDDEEFDDAAEKFEQAYNFRYEDPHAAEIISYARTQATSRRSETNPRKMQRNQQREEKKLEEAKKQEDLIKKKKSKVNKVMDRLKQIKDAVGGDVSDDVINKVFGDSLLNDDFDDADWNNKMAEIFNEQYYDGKDEKPEWGEDDEIMADFYNKNEESSDDGEDDDAGTEKEVAEEKETIEEANEEPASKKSKKDILKDKKSKKKEKESLLAKAEKIVTKNTSKILEEIEEERGRSNRTEDIKFRYRDVSPETFGLSTREILLANDQQLNEFIGLKKFAPYRPKELRMKDKRKLAKKKNLKEWRKQVFRSESGPKVHALADEENDIILPIEEPKKTKKRKHQK